MFCFLLFLTSFLFPCRLLSFCFAFLVLYIVVFFFFFFFLRSVFSVDLYPAVYDGFCYSFYSIKVFFFLLFNVIDNQIPTIKKEMQ